MQCAFDERLVREMVALDLVKFSWVVPSLFIFVCSFSRKYVVRWCLLCEICEMVSVIWLNRIGFGDCLWMVDRSGLTSDYFIVGGGRYACD